MWHALKLQTNLVGAISHLWYIILCHYWINTQVRRLCKVILARQSIFVCKFVKERKEHTSHLSFSLYFGFILGGLWGDRDAEFKGRDGVSETYRSLVANTSKETMAFSDLPMPAHYPTYPRAEYVRVTLCQALRSASRSILMTFIILKLLCTSLGICAFVDEICVWYFKTLFYRRASCPEQ